MHLHRQVQVSADGANVEVGAGNVVGAAVAAV